jgi:hypothetical protein
LKARIIFQVAVKVEICIKPARSMLKNIILILASSIILAACGSGNKAPNVSNIKVDLQTFRFEKDFFAMDTNNLPASFEALAKKYPAFTFEFTEQILGIPVMDTSGMKYYAMKRFLSDYRPIKDSVDLAIGDFTQTEAAIKKGLQYLKHYFPDYQAPKQIITFIGPLDAYAEGRTGGYGDIITSEALAVGLQLHLGSNSVIYTSEQGQRLYPAYISRRFDPAYIPVNCMKNMIDDFFPGLSTDKSLLDLMVDKGKRLYILDQLMPDSPDSLKIGYTADQLKGAEKNEGLIWNFFTENNLLFETDAQKIKSYVGDGPKTMELGDESPGYIALFTGRQIVRAYMDKNPGTSLKDLLSLDAKTILNDSKYKPR